MVWKTSKRLPKKTFGKLPKKYFDVFPPKFKQNLGFPPKVQQNLGFPPKAKSSRSLLMYLILGYRRISLKSSLTRLVYLYINKIYTFSFFLSNGCNKNILFLTLKLSKLSLISLNIKTPNFKSISVFFLCLLTNLSSFCRFSLHGPHLSLIQKQIYKFWICITVCFIYQILKIYRFNVILLFCLLFKLYIKENMLHSHAATSAYHAPKRDTVLHSFNVFCLGEFC